MKNIVRDAEKNKLLITDGSSDENGRTSFDFREKMLMNNHPAGILEMKIYVTDNKKTYEFDTTGLCTLDSIFRDRLTDSNEFKSIFTGMIDVVINSRQFMLEENDFLIGPEYVFLDRERKPYMAYCQGYGKPLSEQLGQIAEYFMNRIDYHDQKAVLMTYTIYMKCREEGFSVDELRRFFEEEVNEGGNSERSNEKVYEMPFLDGEHKRHDPLFDMDELKFYGEQGENTVKGVRKKEITGKTRIKYPIVALTIGCAVILMICALALGLLNSPQGKVDMVKVLALFILEMGIAAYVIKKYALISDHKGSETVMEEETELLYSGNRDDEATELLYDGGMNDRHQEILVLVSEKYPKIRVTNFPFYIGKDPAHMDFLLDYQGVSRYHAKIDRDGPRYVIFDTNSTNGIRHNGRPLTPNQPAELVSGDTISIGVCSYTVSFEV